MTDERKPADQNPMPDFHLFGGSVEFLRRAPERVITVAGAAGFLIIDKIAQLIGTHEPPMSASDHYHAEDFTDQPEG